jgi:hypothetical protein
MYKIHLRNFKTPKIKTCKDTETIKWTQRRLPQTQKDTIKRKIYELKITTQNRKEELNKGMENFRKGMCTCTSMFIAALFTISKLW